MPVSNTRVAVIGAARAEKDFDVVEVSKEAAQKLAEQLARDADAAKREIERVLRGTGR